MFHLFSSGHQNITNVLDLTLKKLKDKTGNDERSF